MTNREYMIEQLQDDSFIDDGGASYEAMIYYHISCSYDCDDERSECYGKPLDKINRDMCVRCKEKWLDSEVEE